MERIEPLTDDEINYIKDLIVPGKHSSQKVSFELAALFLPRLLMEREYLITALQSSQCGQRAITEFFFHMELVENLKTDNQRLQNELLKLKHKDKQTLEPTG